jgi:hypothetical protein
VIIIYANQNPIGYPFFPKTYQVNTQYINFISSN